MRFRIEDEMFLILVPTARIDSALPRGRIIEAIRAVAKGRRFLSPEITGIVVDAGIQGALLARDAQPRLSAREREIL